jgi:glucuronate isomerase
MNWKIYDKCGEMLCTPEFSVRNLMRKMNVKVVCTTDDPIDSLEHHKKIAEDKFEIKVLPTWRPDKAMAVENVEIWNGYIDALAQAAGIDVNNYNAFMDALRRRHDYFHQVGCRISDHGLETACAEDYTEDQIKAIFDKIRSRQEPDTSEQLKFKSAMLVEFGVMDAEKGWVQQFHLGALRNNNTRKF